MTIHVQKVKTASSHFVIQMLLAMGYSMDMVIHDCTRLLFYHYCSQTGKDGARISQFVSGIFENALRFVVGTFQNMLNHSRGRQDVCEWNDWKTLPNWVDRGREIFGNDLEKILMAKCEWSDRGVTDVAKLEIAIALLFSIVQVS